MRRLGVCVVSPPTALDAALEFQRRQVVPSSWRTDVKEESSSSEDEEDEEEEEEQEEDASSEEEEVRSSDPTASPPPAFYSVFVFILLCVPVCRRKWSRSLGRGRTSCSSSTSSWRTEVRADRPALMGH